MINLHSKTGLGRSGHVRFQTFGPIWHVSSPKMVFWRNNLMILHHFCRRSSKIKLFWPKTLIFDQKFPKIPQNRSKYKFFLGFPVVAEAYPWVWRAFLVVLDEEELWMGLWVMQVSCWTWNVPNWTKSLKSDMSGPAKTCFTQ